ncbi:MAG: xanthine dehydrogenase family protein subunit M, partial [Dehalococcoidia bacterium]|nr:xanthine dehydrogenase family protein subunit M [Dehalococcoidia bacterium]
MRDFEYLTPSTVNEVLDILDRKRDEVRVIAGGTSIVPMLKQRLLAADTLVSLQHVKDLKGIRFATDGLHLGATTTHREVEISAQVKKEYPLIAESYSKVATVKIRNSATVAGQLVQADPSQDGAPCHIAMNSKINIISKGSKRTVPVEDFFADYYQAKL